MSDPYRTLGLSKGASEAEIKSAYRKLAKQLHPDRNSDNPKAAERFSDVTKAYDLLSDKDKRAQYDRGEIDGDGNPAMPFGMGGGRAGGGYGGGYAGARGGQAFDFGNDGVDFGDIFEGLFGGGGASRSGGFGGRADPRRQPPAKGANSAYQLAVTLTDAATLAKQRITLSDGKTIDLALPKGVEDGTQMRLTGKGQAGPGGAGDAIITIRIKPHAFYERDGDHIRLGLPLTLKEAVEGGKVKVPTVDGPVMLTVPPGVSSGKVLRLGQRGFTRKDGSRGDQLVTLLIDLPDEDAALRAFVRDWQGGGNPRAHLGV